MKGEEENTRKSKIQQMIQQSIVRIITWSLIWFMEISDSVTLFGEDCKHYPYNIKLLLLQA